MQYSHLADIWSLILADFFTIYLGRHLFSWLIDLGRQKAVQSWSFTLADTKAWKFLDNSVFSKNEKSEAFFRRKTNEKRKKNIYIVRSTK